MTHTNEELELLLAALSEPGPVTRAGLLRRLGKSVDTPLTEAAASSAIKHLLAKGLITETPGSGGDPGRATITVTETGARAASKAYFRLLSLGAGSTSRLIAMLNGHFEAGDDSDGKK